MLCYAMLCYAMLCYAKLCYAVLGYTMLRYAMLCYAMLCYAMLYHAYLLARLLVGYFWFGGGGARGCCRSCCCPGFCRPRSAAPRSKPKTASGRVSNAVLVLTHERIVWSYWLTDAHGACYCPGTVKTEPHNQQRRMRRTLSFTATRSICFPSNIVEQEKPSIWWHEVER